MRHRLTRHCRHRRHIRPIRSQCRAAAVTIQRSWRRNAGSAKAIMSKKVSDVEMGASLVSSADSSMTLSLEDKVDMLRTKVSTPISAAPVASFALSRASDATRR
jgi:hypothetical protein